MGEVKSTANSTPEEGSNSGPHGANFWGSQDGSHDETTTPNIRAGKSTYPNRENSPEMDAAGGSGRTGIDVPLGVDLKSGPTKRADTIAKLPQPQGGK